MDQIHEKLNETIDRSKSLLAIVGVKFSKLARTRKIEGVKRGGNGVKSVATWLLIPYDEGLTSFVARSSRIDERGNEGKRRTRRMRGRTQEHKEDN